jgi:hypothetical protein
MEFEKKIITKFLDKHTITIGWNDLTRETFD